MPRTTHVCGQCVQTWVTYISVGAYLTSTISWKILPQKLRCHVSKHVIAFDFYRQDPSSSGARHLPLCLFSLSDFANFLIQLYPFAVVYRPCML